jgi:hypothetical protein
MRTSKNFYLLVSAFILSASFGTLSFAANAQPPVKKRAALAVDSNSALNPQIKAQLNQALGLVNRGQYQQAVPILYRLTRRPELESQRMQLKYILGSSLLNLGLPQIAAFQFAEVIKNGSSRYVRQSIEQLSLAADALGDESLLNYAISKIDVSQIPRNGKEIIYFRLGEIKMHNGEFTQAIDVFNRVPLNSRYGFQAMYNRGLCNLEMNKTAEALAIFKDMLNVKASAPVTDTNRVIAQLALARTYYQLKDWDNSVLQYREIPRDSVLWHEAEFELTWASFRSAKFRSALSNFQTLHSAYYEDFYIPESLILRAITYLYICKYDEMEKVLDLFERTYGPVRNQVTNFLGHIEVLDYYNEIEAAYNRQIGRPTASLRLPVKVTYKILKEADVRRAFGYLRALNTEKTKLDSYPEISRSEMGQIGRKILGNRYKNAKINIGEMVRTHLKEVQEDLKTQYEQAEFVRYEMINGQKEQVKKRLAGKDLPATQSNEKIDKSVYVQNGYEYWPFDGEYWLDEIGNYHYFGNQSCE